jgi:hypothetical protein
VAKRKYGIPIQVRCGGGGEREVTILSKVVREDCFKMTVEQRSERDKGLISEGICRRAFLV